MKVYVLTSSFGQYEDYYESIEGVFKDLKGAEIVKKKVEDHYTNVPLPFPEYTYEETVEMYFGDSEVPTTEDQYEKIDDWYGLVHHTEFNGCQIKEYELQ